MCFQVQASDRFMRLLERGPKPLEHLVVFITSDDDFSEEIARLQSRSFKVEVLYHDPKASKKPVSVIQAADKAEDWLPFLRAHLGMPNLSCVYDPHQYYPPISNTRLPNASTQAAAGTQPTRTVPQMQPPAAGTQPTRTVPQMQPAAAGTQHYKGCTPEEAKCVISTACVPICSKQNSQHSCCHTWFNRRQFSNQPDMRLPVGAACQSARC